MGPYGPAVIILALPLVVIGLVYACNESGCLQLWPSIWVPGFPPGAALYTHEAMAAVLGWFSLVLLLHKLLPGQVAQGAPLPVPGHPRLEYKLNGEQSLMFLLLQHTCAYLAHRPEPRHPSST